MLTLSRVLLASLLAATGLLFASPAATAAPVTPTGLTVDLSSGSAMVTWDRVVDATSYVLQIDNNDDFSSPLVNQATTNHVFVTTTQLATNSTLYSRVQAKQGNTSGPWSSTVDGQRTRLDAPANALPANDSTFSKGTTPTFSWDAVAGTSNYQIRIATADSSECETSQVKAWTSESTEFVVRDRVLAPSQPYYWCVRAALPNSVYSEWTSPRLVRIDDLGAPKLVSPVAGSPSVRDVALDWDPVAGASSYQLQVGWDQEFNTGIRFDTTLTATRWSPNPNILDNRTWYWRVRALDASGNPHKWSGFNYFTRTWTDQPRLEWPNDDATVATADMYYEWKAVKRADYYTLQTSSDAGFPVSATTNCKTSHTTYVGECGGNPNGYTYWRVLANEDDTLGINVSGNKYTHVTQTEQGQAETRRYRSVIARPAKIWPADGHNVAAGEVPTLSWKPVTFAATYTVTVTNTASGAVTTKSTTATSFTSRTLLAAGTYAWDVVPKTVDNVTISNLEFSSQPTFTVAAYDPDAPVAAGVAPALLTDEAADYRPPTLAWEPVATATKYVIKVMKPNDTAWLQFSESFAYPTGQSTGTATADAAFLAPGTYRWKVVPYKDNAAMTESAVGTFTIRPLYDPGTPTTTTYSEWLASTDIEAALSGNAMYGNNGETADSCHLTTAITGCANLRQTPVLRWQPKDGHTENPNIAFYKISLYADQARTTPVPGYQNLSVRRHAWMPVKPIADAQAGQEGNTSAYWVQLIPCSYAACATSASTDSSISDPLANAFNKSYNQAITSSPTADSTVAISDTPGDNDLVFQWADMLDAEASASTEATSLTNSHADTEASTYQLSYSRLENFSGATTVTVDHTFFTPPTPLSDGDVWWKVRALDDDGKPFNWSNNAHFVVTSPQTTGLSPASAATELGSRQALSWSDTAYASKYVIEAYAGNTPVGTSTTDRKVNDTVFATSWTPSTLLTAGLYTWRVRGLDASGNLMAWSDWAHFTVNPGSPSQLLAPEGSQVAPQDLFMSWTAVDGATGYKVEWRVKASATIASQTTVASSWAPTSALTAAGEWEWRVSALRGSLPWGSTTAWRGFNVTLKPAATTDVSIPSPAAVEDTLILTPPIWDFGDEGQTTYQWYRGSTAIPDATGKAHVLTGDDYNKAVKVVATIKVAGYQDGTSTSDAVTVAATRAPTVTQSPVISGDVHADSILSVSTEAIWSNGADNIYQWLRDGSAISGKTGLSYVVQGADAGHTVSVRATGKRTGYADASVVSNGLSTLSGPAASNTTAPVITGGGAVGSTLSLSAQPTWARNSVSVTASCTTYQWLRDGATISGATRSTYKTIDADANVPVSVRVTCVQTGYDTSAGAVSDAIVPALGPPPSMLVAPSISGTPTLGRKLTASAGTWSPSATSATYQWLRNGAVIVGATKASYTVAQADLGRSLTTTVTVRAAGHASVTRNTSTMRVAKVASRISARLTATTISRTRRGSLSIVVTTAALKSGNVQVFDGSSVIVTRAVPVNGKLKVTLPRLKAGVHRLKVRYVGNVGTTGSTSRVLRLRVKR